MSKFGEQWHSARDNLKMEETLREYIYDLQQVHVIFPLCGKNVTRPSKLLKECVN